jgi:glycosyltransferase involved in cell wall biosynthesis
MSALSKKRLIIADEQLEKIEGHFYEYDKSVADIFTAKGFEVLIYGHADMTGELQAELKARPWFSINTRSAIRKIPLLGAILYRTGFWQKYHRQLNILFSEQAAHRDGSLVFFPNVYWYNILPIARSLKNNSIHAALLYRVSIFDTIGLPKAMQSATMGIISYSVKLMSKNKNVHFYTDSEVIADEWESHFKRDMKVLPIPHLTLNKKDPATLGTGKVRFYLPGGMRIEKGARLLTEALEMMASRHADLLNRITLVTQFPANDETLAGYKNRLAALPVENEFLGRLSTGEYNHQLAIADVILIPYKLSEGYRARTSGILAEAIASAKPFITTEGTWMSLQARKYDTGLIINDNEPGSLVQAIEMTVNSYDEYRQKADTACGKWMASQSKEMYYQLLSAALS